jgi:cytochrome c oxidase assembly protein subunit 15
MTHFVLGLVFLGAAVVLHHQAAIPDVEAAAPRVRLVSRSSAILAVLQLVATTVAVILGTVVTSTGPHGGDPKARRFGFSLHTVAQLHGTSVEVLLAVTLVLMWNLARTRAPRPVMRRAQIVLVALVAQAAVGYSQYLSGDPVAVVAVHVAGACLVVVVVLRFCLGLSVPIPRTGTTAPIPLSTPALSPTT